MNNNIDQNLLKTILDSLIDLNNSETKTETNSKTINKTKTETINKTDTNTITKTNTKTNKCLICKKKVGYLGFECKCDGYFCSAHRYPEEHKCSYDHKTEKINKLRLDNPQIMAEKVKKI